MTASIEYPSGPSFVAKLKEEPGGLDFLGLGQANFDMMAEWAPGLNNTTDEVRPFSLMCWVYWRFQQEMSERNESKIDPRLMRAFAEKVESAFIWVQQELDQSFRGIQSKRPESIDGRVSLTFVSWGGRSASSTSITAAVNYGPALGDIGGLGFLHRIKPQCYLVNPAGVELAEALDHHLRGSVAYSSLADIDATDMTEVELQDLIPYLDLFETTEEEEEIFRRHLFNPDPGAKGRRSATIRALIEILEEAGGTLTVQEVRLAMIRRGALTSPDRPANHQCHTWMVLQLRQLQRLGLESLFSHAEAELQKRRPSCIPPQKFTDLLIEVMRESVTRDSPSLDELTEQNFGIPSDWSSFLDFLDAGVREPERFDMETLGRELEQMTTKKQQDLALGAKAFRALLLCARVTSLLPDNPITRRWIQNGSVERISLYEWSKFLEPRWQHSWPEAYELILQRWVISQHLTVATQRFDGKSIRHRILLEEDGYESFRDRPLRGRMTSDRLASLLSLMASCGLVGYSDEGYHATTKALQLQR
jgi:hypothetical protein